MLKQALFGSMLATSALVGSTAFAIADSWYPSSYDCAPVQSMAWITPDRVGTPHLVAVSMHGKAVVPQDVLVRDARDDRMHVCMQYDPFGELKVTAFFAPPIVRAGL